MKSGFAVLVGRSNVGKSTLLNTIIGTKVAATSFRAQMTRHTIHGVLNTPEGQAVFVDTPGIFKDKRSKLTAKLTNIAKDSVDGIDVIIYVVDPTRDIGSEERTAFGLVRHLDKPKILVINKSDLPREDKKYLEEYRELGKGFDAIMELSALKNSHVEPLRRKVMELMPEGDKTYEEETLTNVTREFFVGELVREKVFSILDKEVPYSVSVEIDSFEETPTLIKIVGRVLVLEERYKKMVIGHGAKRIKEIGMMTRKELEQATGKKIFLKLEVEVDSHWVERM